jgi:hypothetical protein
MTLTQTVWRVVGLQRLRYRPSGVVHAIARNAAAHCCIKDDIGTSDRPTYTAMMLLSPRYIRHGVGVDGIGGRGFEAVD